MLKDTFYALHSPDVAAKVMEKYSKELSKAEDAKDFLKVRFMFPPEFTHRFVRFWKNMKMT